MADRPAPSLKPLLVGLLALAAGSALAQSMLPATALAQAAMTGPVRSDPMQTVGAEVHVRIETLPKPYATPAVANQAVQVPRPADQPLRAPRGFTVTLFRDHVENARNLLVLPNGDVLVAQQRPGSLTLLRDADGDGRAEMAQVWADGFDHPFGLAFHDGAVLVGDLAGVWRLPWTAGTVQAGERRRLTAEGAFGRRSGHNTRSIAVAPDGRHFYVGIGSESNIGVEAEPRATIQEFRMDGSGQRTYAAGLRNPVGLAFKPGTGDLYAVVNERDGLGDQLVPDFLTMVKPGGFYGWPYSYIGDNPQPDLAERRPDLVKAALVPGLLFQAHSAPIGLVFGDATHFPERYRMGAFVSLHGSWNRSRPTGYAVAFVPFDTAPFDKSKPTGTYETFVTGFRVTSPAGTATGSAAEGDETPKVWGRPSGLAVTADGALLIAEDASGTVWRVAYAAADKETEKEPAAGPKR
ncbi:sorbosone dehydrogenase [Azospirillum sp. TSH7]|uniref:PQQ-dependent sugar dehydrogenase n=1 Tax=unclassified Azospirillum TaxID=2630922 RepID=UPI000D61773A|nr:MULTISPECIES: PQQ-dependent sugar dehydrogenase [unclassified Azospirillum]PWC58886.1 sorbosone dehydrogenase [Azospirillum sp. TSH7]PWC60396.1 sorbosone dehydrogenase [Azospirillum sp. TSH20]